MASIHFNTEYSLGEYYTPIDLIKIMLLKYKTINWTIFLFPVRIIVFFLIFSLSIFALPFFLINKIFYLLNKIGEDYIIIAFLMWLINFFYFVSYWIYKIVSIIEFLICQLYQAIPPKTNYISFTTVYNKDEY